jgi:hypothetical protein
MSLLIRATGELADAVRRLTEGASGAARLCYGAPMWWGRKTDPPEKPIREQLIEARESLRRQIEILQAGPASIGKGGEFIDNTDMIAELSGTLREIEQALADGGSGAAR